MKAAILESRGHFVVTEVPTPEPGPGEALVKVSYCAICGSDRRRFSKGVDTGLVLGHEFCGRIAAVGQGVEGWAIGDRVAVDPNVQCNKCYWCLRGEDNLCSNRSGSARAGNPGAYAEYVTAKSSQLFHVPEGAGEKEITMAQCLAVTLRGFHLSRIKMGDSVVVIGAGPIGLMALACSRLAGASSVCVIGKGQGRKQVATHLRADLVLDAAEATRRERSLELTGVGADVVFQCAGDPQAVRDSFALVRPGGVVVIVGSGWATQLSSADIVGTEVNVRGSKSYLPHEFGEAVDLIAGGKIRCDAFITNVEPLSNIQHAFEELQEVSTQVKTLIAP